VPEPETPSYSARLLIDCADRPGIVAAVSGFLFERGANIVSSHQYSSDATGGRFYMRIEFFLEGLAGEREGEREAAAGEPGVTVERVGGERERFERVGGERERFEREFAERVAEPLAMDWEIRYRGERKRLAILVSRHDHCLMDLLWRRRRGELDAEVVAVISNHPDLGEEVRAAGIPFHHVPAAVGAGVGSAVGGGAGNAAGGGAGNAVGGGAGVGTEVGSAAGGGAVGKTEAEQRMLELLAGKVDLVVLARYMQILSGDFLERLGVPAINIHHSFLPAFAGAEPYRRAREHGVKLIGATAHYVTAVLDGGPIIEQDVARVDHRQTVAELERIGRDIERTVLARAVSLHLEDRVIADAGRTIVL
jgi:formyltetrahydrofolate deformylase